MLLTSRTRHMDDATRGIAALAAIISSDASGVKSSPRPSVEEGRPVNKADDGSQDDLAEDMPTSTEIDSPYKNLIKEKAVAFVSELKTMKKYHHGDGIKYEKLIGDLYRDYENEREEIGDYLAELGYAEVIISILKEKGSSKIEEIWSLTHYTYDNAWNYSDASEKFARSLAEAGAVKLMTLNLRHKLYLDNMQNEKAYHVLAASLSTLHNIARRTGVKHYNKKIKTAEVVMPLIKSDDELLKTLAMLILAHIVEEKENAKIIDETNTIKNIVNWIHIALKEESSRRFRGFTPWELTQGLAKLAVNDSNKRKILEEGVLDDLRAILRHTDPKEQASAAECIWTLAFDKSVRQAIIEFPDLVPALEELAKSTSSASSPQTSTAAAAAAPGGGPSLNSIVRKNVQGALWLIKGDNDPTSNTTRTHNAQGSKNHVFISYSWKAEYMFQLRKDYIPLMCQKRYRPDGWLGAILGAKLFYDFSGKYPYEKPLQGLLKELRGRGKSAHAGSIHSKPSVDEVDSSPFNHHAVTSSSGSAVGSSSLTPDDRNAVAEFVTMDEHHVKIWLVSQGLQRLTRAFSKVNGKYILQMKKMRETAPEYYYSSLERRFRMSRIDILSFNAALDSLG
ncbi:hypothetical protein PoB_000775100 [Plakobranchus ocellatus]|uniref:Uncharacterized protein n=1 Tax=Plakobranchus ocellatus TaxID=259542 RepID=A0AAV3Y1Z5_9GAST|nr:hypothetical protein PoB_000775100 [Plakobranchus ocellatus]